MNNKLNNKIHTLNNYTDNKIIYIFNIFYNNCQFHINKYYDLTPDDFVGLIRCGSLAKAKKALYADYKPEYANSWLENYIDILKHINDPRSVK